MATTDKGVGSTHWHSHDDQDEVFLLVEGALMVQLRNRDIQLRPGDLFVVPCGVEHCPVALDEARFLIIGPSATSNVARGEPDWSNTSEVNPSRTAVAATVVATMRRS
jgi:mannose-6-phosphate isomerase-like protein (cupin superfamily)